MQTRRLVFTLSIVSFFSIWMAFSPPEALAQDTFSACYNCKQQCKKAGKDCKEAGPKKICKKSNFKVICYVFEHFHCPLAEKICHQTRCELIPECGPKPPPSPPSPPGPGAKGEPHFETLDGLRYDFQAVGEFILLRDASSDFEIQVRSVPYNLRSLAVLKVVALRYEKHILIFQKDTLSVDGKISRIPGEGLTIDEGKLFIRKSDTNAWIIRAGKHEIWVEHWSSYLNISVNVAATSKQKTIGLLGNFDGDPKNDFRDRTGLVFDYRAMTHDILYTKFGNAWRLQQSESFLPYAKNENTQTYTDLSFPKEDFSIGSLTPKQLEIAETNCMNATARNLRNCVYDVGATGDASFANSYVFATLSDSTPMLQVDILGTSTPTFKPKKTLKTYASITLKWTASTDLDLHLKTPSGVKISSDISDQVQGGGATLVQDACYKKSICDKEKLHIEKIEWKKGNFPNGIYEVWIENADGRNDADFELVFGYPNGKRIVRHGKLQKLPKAKSSVFIFNQPTQ